MSTKDLSPVLPAKIQVIYPVRRCAGVPSDNYPIWYVSSVNLSDITFTDTFITPKPIGTTGTTKTFRDSATALYSTTAGPASNKTALDALAKQIATDFADFRSQSFDIVYNGVAAVPPNALVDLLTVEYGVDDLKTRIQSQPLNGEPEEYQHFDPATASCTDANNSGKPIDPIPCHYVYGPPESCTGGGGAATGNIVSGGITSYTVTAGGTFTGTPTVAIYGDGVGATGTAVLTGTALTSITPGAPGTGYTFAIVSLHGGGSKLERCRYLICLRDGRLEQTFYSWDTIG